jgi:hypothetical protein
LDSFSWLFVLKFDFQNCNSVYQVEIKQAGGGIRITFHRLNWLLPHGTQACDATGRKFRKNAKTVVSGRRVYGNQEKIIMGIPEILKKEGSQKSGLHYLYSGYAYIYCIFYLAL